MWVSVGWWSDDGGGVADRAVCLRRHLARLPPEAVVLDFRHPAGHVSDATGRSRRSFRAAGDETAEGEASSQDVLHAVWYDDRLPVNEP
jgi:hypothetical protein